MKKCDRYFTTRLHCLTVDLYRFPEMTRGGVVGSSSNTSLASERRRRQQDLNHDTEVIFVLPSLQMNFKTIHLQGMEEPREGGTYHPGRVTGHGGA